MQLQHTVTHELPPELAHQAQSAGLTDEKVAGIFQRWGPLGIKVIQELLLLLQGSLAGPVGKVAGAPLAEHKPADKPTKG